VIGSRVVSSLSEKTLWAFAAGKVDIADIRGKNYFENTVKAVDTLGGIKEFVPKGSVVGVLINSAFSNPGTITSTDVALSVLQMCINASAKEVWCLRPAGSSFWERSELSNKYEKLLDSIKQADRDYKSVKIPKGKSLKEAEIESKLLECDVFINVPIVKNHKGTNFSCTLKNLMGITSRGTNRFIHTGWGGRGGYDNIEWLSQCIADLNLIRKPDLCVVDATEFVTTNGPYGPGKLLRIDRVIAGRDTASVDSYCCRFLNLTEKEIDMIRFANQHGLGEIDIDKLKIEKGAA
jgi:uncharacterized protein (DUF362 family)